MENSEMIEKLNYVYLFIDTGQGDKKAALARLQEVASELDVGGTCGGGGTIPFNQEKR